MTDQFMPSARRGFLFLAATAVATLLLPTEAAWADKPKAKSKAGARLATVPGLRPASSRNLSLINVNTGERWDGVYWRDGVYVPDAMRRLDQMLRDHKAGQIAHMDPKLYDQLWELHQRLGSGEPWKVISAYRSPRTNAIARRTHRGVARNSFHIQARALDVDLADRSVKAIRQAALSLQAGGVGQYPRSEFVHLDTGPVRSWG